MAHTQNDSPPARYRRIADTLKWSGISATAFCIVAYFAYFKFRHAHLGGSDAWGQFGDFVGGIAGTALSMATLWALAHTLSLQATELDATKRLLNKQAFEATFFQLLGRLVTISDQHLRDGIFRYVTERMNHFVAALPAAGDEPRLVRAYASSYATYASQLGPHFRTLYHIVKFVDSSERLSDKEKEDYISMARAQLSSTELVVLLANVALGKEGSVGMKASAERYGLLKHTKDLDLPAWAIEARGMLHADAFRSRAEREANRTALAQAN